MTTGDRCRVKPSGRFAARLPRADRGVKASTEGVWKWLLWTHERRPLRRECSDDEVDVDFRHRRGCAARPRCGSGARHVRPGRDGRDDRRRDGRRAGFDRPRRHDRRVPRRTRTERASRRHQRLALHLVEPGRVGCGAGCATRTASTRCGRVGSRPSWPARRLRSTASGSRTCSQAMAAPATSMSSSVVLAPHVG